MLQSLRRRGAGWGGRGLGGGELCVTAPRFMCVCGFFFSNPRERLGSTKHHWVSLRASTAYLGLTREHGILVHTRPGSKCKDRMVFLFITPTLLIFTSRVVWSNFLRESRCVAVSVSPPPPPHTPLHTCWCTAPQPAPCLLICPSRSCVRACVFLTCGAFPWL